MSDLASATVKPLILQALSDFAWMTTEQIYDGIVCPQTHIDDALYSLMCGLQIDCTEGTSEGEWKYRLCKVAEPDAQQEMFT
jgi:hypothetical protein